MTGTPDGGYDCVIAGGGPAGLSAALILGRARRRVLVCDSGSPRNRASIALHAYLTREGVPPVEFLRTARAELDAYDGVEFREVEVTDAERLDGQFQVRLADGAPVRCRTLLVCTGVVDDVPQIDGLAPLYGRTVHHCPYCDGWEHRDEPLAVYGCGDAAVRFALALTRWSPDLILCTDGPGRIESASVAELAQHGIGVREERILKLEGQDGRLDRIVFDTGEPLARAALFFCTGQRQSSDLAARVGARLTEKGTVETGKAERTAVPGLWVAGDASQDAQLVIVAAAEGAEAAVAINTALTKEDLAGAPIMSY